MFYYLGGKGDIKWKFIFRKCIWSKLPRFPTKIMANHSQTSASLLLQNKNNRKTNIKQNREKKWKKKPPLKIADVSGTQNPDLLESSLALICNVYPFFFFPSSTTHSLIYLASTIRGTYLRTTKLTNDTMISMHDYVTDDSIIRTKIPNWSKLQDLISYSIITKSIGNSAQAFSLGSQNEK